MKVREQLQRLMRLQDLVLEAQAARETVDAAPGRVEEIEGRFRERNAEYVAVKERYDALETDRKTRSEELVLLEQQRDKYKDDLTKVQNEREYAAMLKEIDAVKMRISENEEAILSDMEEIAQAKEELESREAHIQTEREQVGKERAEVESAADAARERIEKLTTERAALEGELPARVVASARKLEASRGGQFLAKAEDGTCQSCYVRVRPQVFQEIKLLRKIHFCSSCRRLLYQPDTLERATAQSGSSEETSGAGGVEAVNG